MFVDNGARVIYGQLYINDYDQGEFGNRFVSDVMATIRSTYQKELGISLGQGRALPAASGTLTRMKQAIAAKILDVDRRP